MSTTSMAIFSNPLFATYSVYARNASIAAKIRLKKNSRKWCITLQIFCLYSSASADLL